VSARAIKDEFPHAYSNFAILIFVASGFSGLIYQSTWTQYLGLYLGHAAYAQCLVLAIFMGGLALGSWLASWKGNRWRNLLIAYAAVELLIGVLGILFHPVYLIFTEFSYNTLLPSTGPTLGAAIKWVTGALLIAPQSILLGMTFPLMSNGLIRTGDAAPGKTISALYFANSFGAALGALSSTFVFLPRIGLPGTMCVGGAIGLGVALAALLIARQATRQLHTAPEDFNARSSAVATTTTSRLLLIAAFITGATSFVYELVWVRMLSLLFGTTLHSFELMLTAFIGGLAMGGWAIRNRIDHASNLIRVGGYVQIAMGIAALATMSFYGQSFQWVAFLMHGLARDDQGYYLFNVATALVAILIMCPAAFFAGMTLPIFTLELTRNGTGEAAVGRIYAANTFGAIVGVVATIALLIPIFGLKLAMTMAALADIALGVALYRSSIEVPGRRYLAILAGSAGAAVLLILVSPFDRRELASGVYRTSSARIPEDATIRFYQDGSTASVSVGERRGIRQVATNGKSDSAIQVIPGQQPTQDENTMTLAGVLPLAFMPRAKDVAIIGIGTGMTSNTMLGFPTLRTVDTIEIEPAMATASRQFGDFSARLFADPRSHIHFEDARVFFAERNAPYDVIVSEPSNPWVTGVASLFTEEFYGHVTRHLAEDGIFVQWVQQYEINDALVATIANALSKHFADYSLILANDSDLLIIATPGKSLGTMDAGIFDIPAIRSSLAHINIHSMADIALHSVGRKSELEDFLRMQSEDVNSDFHPILSLEAPRARFASQSATALHSLLESDLPVLEMTQKKEPIHESEISLDPNFSRSYDVEAAREFVKLWNDENYAPELLDNRVVAAISALKSYHQTCQPSGTSQTVLNWMYEVASSTAPYLEPSQLAIFHTSDAMKRCNPESSIVLRFSLLLDSVFDRDANLMASRASDLLHSERANLPPDIADYVLRVAMLGRLAGGASTPDVEPIEVLGTQISSPDVKINERRYLWARSQRHLESGASR
jgi:predicted membrane-bound spermidine synthase